ncbi:hypothetical protein SPFL3102_01849 [Sporomusaceae bacterium FL31]|nr:hypothetical protein SPFL3101_03483 [Sporomusaceae bacterium FL31]GCE34040.1 hypothetical protein SPFL3102_01849 [Sporomusaceae bacterium]
MAAKNFFNLAITRLWRTVLQVTPSCHRTIGIAALGMAFLLAVSCNMLVEAKENGTVSFKPVWSVNDTAKYLMTKSKTQDGRTQEVSSVITTTVIGKTKDQYVFEWRCEEFDTGNQIPAAYKELFNGLIKGMRIQYATDPQGRYQGIVNPEEIRSGIRQFGDAMLARIDDEQLRKSISGYLKIWLQNDQLIDLTAKEIAYLHNPYFFGEVFEPDEQYEMEVRLPNPFLPSQPFAGVVTLKAARSGDVKEMLIEQELDKEQSTAILKDTLKQLAAMAGRQPDAEINITSLDIKDTFHYSIKESNSWIDRCSVTRSFALNGKSRSESVEFVRQE